MILIVGATSRLGILPRRGLRRLALNQCASEADKQTPAMVAARSPRMTVPVRQPPNT